MSKFRYYITSEDYSVLGTNDEALAEQYKFADDCSVIDTQKDVYWVGEEREQEIKESDEVPESDDEVEDGED